MKLNAKFCEREANVEIRWAGSRVFAEIDNRAYELDLHEFGLGRYMLISAGRVFNCRIEGRLAPGKPIDVIVGDKRDLRRDGQEPFRERAQFIETTIFTA